MDRLPGRVVAVLLGTILIFVLTLGASLLWMAQALDRQARGDAQAQVGSAMGGILAQARSMTLDYAKWDEAADRVATQDMGWLFDNLGIAAVLGESLQVAVLWGGPFESDLGWSDDGGTAPQAGHLADAALAQAERQLARVAIGTYDGTQPFYVWRGDDLFAVAAARVEHALRVSASLSSDADLARLALGQRIDEGRIDAIAETTLVTELTLHRDRPADLASLPLAGPDGWPVAHLAWVAPAPGTELLLQMAPILVPLLVLAAGLALRGMWLVHHSTSRLVEAERLASEAARTDALTGLPNRAAFTEVLARPGRLAGRAVLFLDVNGFKRVNDGIGHAAGDELIRGVARRLDRLAGPDCFLARIAGDEFVFVLLGSGAAHRVRLLAEAAAAHVLAPFAIQGHQVQVTLAMGYAVQAGENESGDDLLRQADLAMYEAKRQSAVGAVAYSAVIEKASDDAATLERALRAALAREGELTIAYQPIVGRDGRLVRAEALARWTSAELGSIPPDRFIAVAEQAGLIVELGRRLLQLICDDLAAHPTLHVSINISPLQLLAPDFVPNLTAELGRRGIDPTRVEMELTEAVLVDDARLASQRLRELQAAGFTTALDDFGTGYSSMGYLEQLRFQTLKIDRSFVARIRNSPEGIAVIDGMIRMAHGLRLRVVCEGVETAEELSLLHELGCDGAQGYHLDRPIPIGALTARWLAIEAQSAVA